MVSKANVVGIYQRKLEEIARLGVDLLALTPPSWRDERGELLLERVYTRGYRLEATPIHFNGSFHLHYYPALARHLAAFRPDIVHIDEEPYNVASWQALYHARRHGARAVLFSWQNINRRYPPPFVWGERWVLRHIDHLIAGTDSAAQVWREKGYRGSISVIPQFGIDPVLFAPDGARPPDRPFTIGYAGRLVEEKGVDLLIAAAAQLPGEWRLVLVGGGPERDRLHAMAREAGIAERVEFADQVQSTEMPAFYRRFDVLALPSRTRPNWKEQFGRALVEAMASGVPVIGSNSGAIPDVIGEAGLIFPEGDAQALAHHLAALLADAGLRATLGEKGRQRALACFTHERIAAATVEVYRQVAAGG